MRNALLILGLLATIGCNKDNDGETDTDTDTDTDTEPDYHPLVPEQFRYLWNTEGCETSDGSAGTSIAGFASFRIPKVSKLFGHKRMIIRLRVRVCVRVRVCFPVVIFVTTNGRQQPQNQ